MIPIWLAHATLAPPVEGSGSMGVFVCLLCAVSTYHSVPLNHSGGKGEGLLLTNGVTFERVCVLMCVSVSL